jgi:hypothetical protein
MILSLLGSMWKLDQAAQLEILDHINLQFQQFQLHPVHNLQVCQVKHPRNARGIVLSMTNTLKNAAAALARSVACKNVQVVQTGSTVKILARIVGKLSAMGATASIRKSPVQLGGVCTTRSSNCNISVVLYYIFL